MISKIWDDLVNGVLCDEALRRLADSKQVLTGDFDLDKIEGAAVEFSIGDRLLVISQPEERRQRELTKDEVFLIAPRSTVVVKLRESIDLPLDGIARFILKGSLFSVGIAPINTMADPGFEKFMGIALTNTSDRYLKLKEGTPIVKAIFEKLPQKATKGYAGGHGYNLDDWPVLTQYWASQSDIALHDVDPSDFSEIEKSYGPVVANLRVDVDYWQYRIWIQLSVALLAFGFALYLTGTGAFASIVSCFAGVSANVLTAIILRYTPLNR